MNTSICVVGTVATAPKTLRTSAGTAMCSFRLASTERRFNRTDGTWSAGDTNWFTVTTFRTLAEHAAASFSVGDRIIVNGRLRVKRWQHEGNTRLNVEIDAEALGHDLRWGCSVFRKAETSQSEPGNVPTPPETLDGDDAEPPF